MATRLFKRTNSKDVFDKLQEQDEPSNTQVPDSTPEVDAEPTDSEGGTPDVDAEPNEAPDHDPEIEDSAEEAPKLSRRRWVRRVLAAVVALVFVAALGAAGYLGWQLKQSRDTAAAGRAALTVAQSYAATLTTVDSNKIDENFTQVLNGATGEFKDMYSQSATQLRQLLIDNKATSKGIVVDSAIKSASKTKVEVLLFIDQSISNSVTPEPRIDRSRVAMTMELIDGKWLASNVEIK
jgi:Mce-associated membrane protein